MSVPGVMLYSHDTYGLGHERRTLALTSVCRSRRSFSRPTDTGSPVALRSALPVAADFTEFQSVVKVAAGAHEPGSLDVLLRTIRNVRRDVLLGAAQRFGPKLLPVDKVPTGSPTLAPRL